MNIQIDKKLAQQIVSTVKDVCGYNINFIDCSGTIYASTDEKRIGNFHEVGLKAVATKTTIEVETDNSYSGTQKGVNLPILHNGSIIAVIGITGPPEEVKKFAHLAERITNLLIREKELDAFRRTQEDKRHYIIQTLISNNHSNYEYLADALDEWGIDKNSGKRMLLVQLNSRYHLSNIQLVQQEIQQLFSQAGIRLFTYNYPNEYLAVMDDSLLNHKSYLLKEFCARHQGILKMALGKCCPICQMADSHASALTALKSLPESADSYALFDQLTLEIILSNMDSNSRKEYLAKTVSQLTTDDLAILSTYFEEDMSLINTSRKLFVHKNTLQYQLDRIYRTCGYNPRSFREAVLLYLAIKLEGGSSMEKG